MTKDVSNVIGVTADFVDQGLIAPLKNYHVGSNGFVYKNNFFGNQSVKINKMKDIVPELPGRIGLISDAVPVIFDVIEISKGNTEEVKSLVKDGGILGLGFFEKTSFIGAIVVFFDWYAGTPAGERAIQQALKEKSNRENKDKIGGSLPVPSEQNAVVKPKTDE